MKKLAVILASLLITTNAFAADLVTIATTIQDDVAKHATSVIHNQGSNFKAVQKDLTIKIESLNTIADQTELKDELVTLKNTMSETKVIHALRESLKKELSSEPTPEELMKTYFLENISLKYILVSILF